MSGRRNSWPMCLSYRYRKVVTYHSCHLMRRLCCLCRLVLQMVYCCGSCSRCSMVAACQHLPTNSELVAGCSTLAGFCWHYYLLCCCCLSQPWSNGRWLACAAPDEVPEDLYWGSSLAPHSWILSVHSLCCLGTRTRHVCISLPIVNKQVVVRSVQRAGCTAAALRMCWRTWELLLAAGHAYRTGRYAWQSVL